MISVKNLSAGYGGKDVIDGIDLEIKKGERLSIIGPNGCGKTTLLRTIAGILPYKGTILLDSKSLKDYPGKSLAKKLGMLSQLSPTDFGYTVIETVLMGRYAHSRGIFSGITGDDRTAALEALKSVGLEGYKDRYASKLSGGQLQRVFLAKLLAQNPEVVLLDEPTNHLDLSCQVELIELLKNWAVEKEKTIIGVLHDMNLAMSLSENLLLMKDGAILGLGKATEIIVSSKINEAFEMDVPGYMRKSLEFWKAG